LWRPLPLPPLLLRLPLQLHLPLQSLQLPLPPLSLQLHLSPQLHPSPQMQSPQPRPWLILLPYLSRFLLFQQPSFLLFQQLSLLLLPQQLFLQSKRLPLPEFTLLPLSSQRVPFSLLRPVLLLGNVLDLLLWWLFCC
ncbi:hypothetical protein HDU98_005441, partial [Podochytrium sp. JEL0797]